MTRTRTTHNERREQLLQAALDLAREEGLAAVSVRAVAGRCELSGALVLFHFDSRGELVRALLERMLCELDGVEDTIARVRGTGLARLSAVIDAEMIRLARTSSLAEVFFEFWVLGLREPMVRSRMRAALRTYRRSFEPLAAAAIAAEPDAFRGVSASGLAGLAVATVQGTTLQAALDPRGLQLRPVQRAFAVLARRLARPPRSQRALSAGRSEARS